MDCSERTVAFTLWRIYRYWVLFQMERCRDTEVVHWHFQNAVSLPLFAFCLIFIFPIFSLFFFILPKSVWFIYLLVLDLGKCYFHLWLEFLQYIFHPEMSYQLSWNSSTRKQSRGSKSPIAISSKPQAKYSWPMRKFSWKLVLTFSQQANWGRSTKKWISQSQ